MKDFLGCLLYAVLSPFLLIAVIVLSIIERIKELKNSHIKKPSPLVIGILILLIPMFYFAVLYVIWNVLWMFYYCEWVISMKNPLFTLFGVIVPIIGGLLIVIGSTKK